MNKEMANEYFLRILNGPNEINEIVNQFALTFRNGKIFTI